MICAKDGDVALGVGAPHSRLVGRIETAEATQVDQELDRIAQIAPRYVASSEDCYQLQADMDLRSRLNNS